MTYRIYDLGRGEQKRVLIVLNMASQRFRVEVIRVVVAYENQVDLVERNLGCFEFFAPSRRYDLIRADAVAKKPIDEYLLLTQCNQKTLIRKVGDFDEFRFLRLGSRELISPSDDEETHEGRDISDS